MGHRVMLTVAIAVIILILLACIGYMSGRWTEEEQKQGVLEYLLASASSQPVPDVICISDEESRERIRTIMIEALDQALHEQVEHLFLTWLKDSRGQPDRARTGVRQAIAAHQMAKRDALAWMPPLCSG